MISGRPAANDPRGRAAPETARPSIHEIARLAGVSPATVSRVANDHPEVATETRQRVQRVMAAHGYATTPRNRPTSGLISVNVPAVEAQYFAAILGGISEGLDAAGFGLLLHPNQSRVPLGERLAAGSTDGAILVLPPESLEELQALQRHSVPFAVIDPRVLLDAGIPCVAAANAAGARKATSHLLELGHRRIGLVAGPKGWAATQERTTGALGALVDAGLPPLKSRICEHGDWSIEGGRAAARRMLARDDRPTAIFAFNDEMAIGVLAAAAERNLRVPTDLSVVGFDDVDRSQIVSPPITTVRQPLAEMGRVAVSLVLRLVAGHRVDAVRVELATRLVVRESTAPPASQARLLT